MVCHVFLAQGRFVRLDQGMAGAHAGKWSTPTSSWERHEAKYVIPFDMVPAIRDFIQPFTVPDPHGAGKFPEYEVVTLQLDGPGLPLYRAKEEEAVNRFKLRVRTYGNPAESEQVYAEIKRRCRGVVVKSRVALPSENFDASLFTVRGPAISWRNATEQSNFYEFVRLKTSIGADPKLLVRYQRESYFGSKDNYARVTFDREICYQPTRRWSLIPPGPTWWTIDSGTAMNRPYAGVVLELKTFANVPRWMMALVKEFDLVRVGFCKYACAVRMESLFSGAEYSSASETTPRF